MFLFLDGDIAALIWDFTFSHSWVFYSTPHELWNFPHLLLEKSLFLAMCEFWGFFPLILFGNPLPLWVFPSHASCLVLNWVLAWYLHLWSALSSTLSSPGLCPASSSHLGLRHLPALLPYSGRRTGRPHLVYFLCANVSYLSSGNTLSNCSVHLICVSPLRDWGSLLPIFNILKTFCHVSLLFFPCHPKFIYWVLAVNVSVFRYGIYKEIFKVKWGLNNCALIW